MHRSKRTRMDNYDEGAATSSDYHNGDILDSDDEQEEKEYSSEEEEEESNSEEDGSDEKSEDGDQQASEDEEDYNPWQTLIHEAKLQLLDEFQENVEYLKNEGFSEVEAKRQSFSALLPKLTKQLGDVYLDHLQWMSEMEKDPVHKKIMETKEAFVNDDSFDPDEAMEAAIEKRKFLLQHMLEDKQHFYDSDDDDNAGEHYH